MGGRKQKSKRPPGDIRTPAPGFHIIVRNKRMKALNQYIHRYRDTSTCIHISNFHSHADTRNLFCGGVKLLHIHPRGGHGILWLYPRVSFATAIRCYRILLVFFKCLGLLCRPGSSVPAHFCLLISSYKLIIVHLLELWTSASLVKSPFAQAPHVAALEEDEENGIHVGTDTVAFGIHQGNCDSAAKYTASRHGRDGLISDASACIRHRGGLSSAGRATSWQKEETLTTFRENFGK